MDTNLVVLIGRLTKDSEIKYTSAGLAVMNFSIALSKNVKGEKKTDFFDVTAFGKMAESLNPYLTKGRQVAIQGALSQDRWQGQDGQNHSKISVIADNIQLLGSKETSASAKVETQTAPVQGEFPEDIPF